MNAVTLSPHGRAVVARAYENPHCVNFDEWGEYYQGKGRDASFSGIILEAQRQGAVGAGVPIGGASFVWDGSNRAECLKPFPVQRPKATATTAKHAPVSPILTLGVSPACGYCHFRLDPGTGTDLRDENGTEAMLCHFQDTKGGAWNTNTSEQDIALLLAAPAVEGSLLYGPLVVYS